MLKTMTVKMMKVVLVVRVMDGIDDDDAEREDDDDGAVYHPNP